MNCLTRWYVRDHNLITLREKLIHESKARSQGAKARPETVVSPPAKVGKP